MISPDTSGAIFTSTSGWIFPVAVTSCVTDLRNALSVVIGIGLSFFRAATIAVKTTIRTTAAPIRMKSFFFDRFACIVAHYERSGGTKVARAESLVVDDDLPILVGCDLEEQMNGVTVAEEADDDAL